VTLVNGLYVKASFETVGCGEVEVRGVIFFHVARPLKGVEREEGAREVGSDLGISDIGENGGFLWGFFSLSGKAQGKGSRSTCEGRWWWVVSKVSGQNSDEEGEEDDVRDEGACK